MIKTLLRIAALIGIFLVSPSFAEEKVAPDSRTLKYTEGSGRPTAEEFILAAKKTFFTYGFEYLILSESVAKGRYKKYVCVVENMIMSLEIVCTASSDTGKVHTLKRYSGNIEKSLRLELAKYLL